MNPASIVVIGIVVVLATLAVRHNLKKKGGGCGCGCGCKGCSGGGTCASANAHTKK